MELVKFDFRILTMVMSTNLSRCEDTLMVKDDQPGRRGCIEMWKSDHVFQ